MKNKFISKNTVDHENYIGPESSLSINSDDRTMHVHDGQTPNGIYEIGQDFKDLSKNKVYALNNGKIKEVIILPISIDISAGGDHGYSLVNGEVYSVGYNYYGQLGLGDSGTGTNRNTWTPTGLTNVTAIAAGGDGVYSHGYALVNGEVYSVGRNNAGQLGLGDTTDRNTWTPTGLTNVTAFAVGGASVNGGHGYTLVDGEVYSVGYNHNGQLGLGDTTRRTTWTPTGLTNVTAIAAGGIGIYSHGYALVNGEVYSVGGNGSGQLGLGDTTRRTTWTPTGLTNVTAIAAGGSHGYALVDGEVYSVGNNAQGQLGLGDTTRRTTWTPTGLTNVTAIAAGGEHGYALVDGEVYSVGRNNYGQLGLGDSGSGTDRNIWTPTGLTNVTAITAGSTHGYALVNGEVYSVGRNNYGQLGLGDNTDRNIWTPTGLQ